MKNILKNLEKSIDKVIRKHSHRKNQNLGKNEYYCISVELSQLLYML